MCHGFMWDDVMHVMEICMNSLQREGKAQSQTRTCDRGLSINPALSENVYLV